MNTDQIVDNKVKTMTDLSGKKSKVLLLKNETEIEAFKEQLRLYSVVGRSEQFYCFDEKNKRIDRCATQCETCKKLKLMQ